MKPVFFFSLMNGAAWGGSEELWFHTALWMSRHGYKIGIGCYDWAEKQNRISELKKAGCTIYLLPNKKGLFKKAAIKKTLHSIPFQKYGLTVVNQGGWEEILHSPFIKEKKKTGFINFFQTQLKYSRPQFYHGCFLCNFCT